MTGRPKLENKRISRLALLGALLGACVEGDVVEVDLDGGGRCFADVLYLVQGDVFTRMSAGIQSIDTSGQSFSSSPTGWNPDIDPRAKSQIKIRGYKGEALLLWNDVVVDRFALTKEFLRSDQEIGILAHQDADGRRVELHVYGRTQCELPPAVATRAQIEAVETPL